MSGKIITKEEFLAREEFYLGEIKGGKIFIYPTDTIYGLGCDATNPESVEKVREVKQRDKKPFSVIVPNKEWIITNCDIYEKFIGELDKLPGKFTLILKLKKNVDIANKELIGGVDTLGVRIPDNWFGEFISRKDLVFVTTSVNIAGEKPIQKISDLKEEILDEVDYVIDDGELSGSASTLVDLSEDEVKLIER